MIIVPRFLFCLLMLVMAFGAPLRAAPVTSPTPPTSKAVIMRPLTLLKLGNLDFGTLAVTTGGFSTISPTSGLATLTGGLLQAGGTPAPARFRGTASRLSLIIIRSSTPTVLLRRSGGTETLTLDNLTLNGSAIQLVGDTPFDFAVGGRLTVPAGAVDGVYSATFDITIEYY